MQVWMLEESFLYLTTWGDYGLEINGHPFAGSMWSEDDEYDIYDRAWNEDVAVMHDEWDEDVEQSRLDEARDNDYMSQAETEFCYSDEFFDGLDVTHVIQ
jgi:hypothetical protein